VDAFLHFLAFWLTLLDVLHYYNIWRDNADTILNHYNFFRVEYWETIFFENNLKSGAGDIALLFFLSTWMWYSPMN
jgi:hypothetical protein